MTSNSFVPTPRTTPTRKRQRVGYDRAAAYAVLDEAFVCHVGFVADGWPVVLPHLFVRVADRLYLHGSSGARALRSSDGAGLNVCVTVTLTDGIVLARSAQNHSINYRSVVAYGPAALVTDVDEQAAALAALVDGVVPGRSAEVRGPSPRELAATGVLRLPLDEVSLKVRSGPPVDDADDLELPYWAGVLPLRTVADAPVPSPDLAADVDLPEHVARWTRAAAV